MRIARPRRSVRTRVVAATGVLALVGGAAATALQWERSYTDESAVALSSRETAASTVIFDCFQQPFFAPSDITLSCRNFRTAVWDLDWDGWGTDRARADDAAYVVSDCRRACTEESWTAYPVHAELDQRETRQGVSQYTMLTVTFTEEMPPRIDDRTLRFTLPREP